MNCKNYFNSCGDCSRCGECCAATLPITKEEEDKIKKYIEENQIEPEFFQSDKDMNLNCCFYDRKNKVCKIYKVRPNICRSFKCNKSLKQLEKERKLAHEKAYWNKLTEEKITNLMDMRLLFYDDPRTLIANIIYSITNGTMKCDNKKFKFLKDILIQNNLEELANCLEGKFSND